MKVFLIAAPAVLALFCLGLGPLLVGSRQSGGPRSPPGPWCDCCFEIPGFGSCKASPQPRRIFEAPSVPVGAYQ